MKNRQRYRRNMFVLLFIVITAIIILIYQHIYIVNKIYNFEGSNPYYWQKYMNEDEFNNVEHGMTYMEVTEIAKGGGKQISENVFVWEDEILMTKAYELHFQNNQLIDKKVIERRGYSTR